MKDYSSSVNREQLRYIKYNSTAEQRMNWWLDAFEFMKASRNNWANLKRKTIKN